MFGKEGVRLKGISLYLSKYHHAETRPFIDTETLCAVSNFHGQHWLSPDMTLNFDEAVLVIRSNLFSDQWSMGFDDNYKVADKTTNVSKLIKRYMFQHNTNYIYMLGQ